MSAVPEQLPLKICLLGFDRKNLNALKLFFSRADVGYCKLSLPEQADLIIVDLDRYGVADEWQVLRQNRPDVHAVLFSVNNKVPLEDDPNPERIFTLLKPVKIPQLLASLKDVRESMHENGVDLMPGFPWSPTDQPDLLQADDQVNTDDQTDRPASEAEPSKSQIDQAIADVAFLSELGTLLDEVKRNVKRANNQGVGVRLHMIEQGNIFIDPSEHWVFTDFSDATLRELCTERFNSADISVSEFADGESAKYVEGWTQRRETPLDVDSFLWDLALWTYNGLLPTGTRLDHKVELKVWPDLPRLTPIPFAMRIAALWTSCPVSLIETVEVLNIPAEHVFKFYACCYTLGLIRQLDPKEHSNSLERTRPDKERRRFYLNILNHIKGKDFD